MGNKKNKTKTRRRSHILKCRAIALRTNAKRWSNRNIENNETVFSSNNAKFKHLRQPKKLSALCKVVIKQYKLDRDRLHKDVKIDECYIVGGKPLRRRSAPTTYDFKKPPKPKAEPVKKRRLKKKKTEDKIPNIVVKTKHEEDREISKNILSINPEPSIGMNVEQDRLEDPLCQEDYLVEIKEEPIEFGGTATTVTTTVTAEAEKVSVQVPSLFVSTSAPSASTSVSSCPLGTVVMDDIQIFANRVAEQLRSFPPQRALLIQVEIQYMIDNEKQLLLDEQS